MKAHFIGLGGVGMSATAKLLRDAGWAITGSDEAVYPPISTVLEKEKLECRTPYAPSNIPPDVDLIVIGKNAKLVPETNAEVAAAYQSGKRIASFPEVLGELSTSKTSVVVAGSYGKSSCSALLAHILQSAGLDPSFFIGAVPLTPSSPAQIGKGDLFVFEGDEYPSSNTDNRSKFLHLKPKHILLTPLAHDHVNIFPTVDAYLAPFKQLVTLLPPATSLIAATSGPLSKQFLGSIKSPAITYGVSEGDYTVTNITYGENDKTKFDIIHNGKSVCCVATTQLGEHSIENILGCAAFVFTNCRVTPQAFVHAIDSFKGVMRRLDKKSDKTSIPMYEGFGSSYDKARSAIAAVKRGFPNRNLVVVFEPHTFSWRSHDTLHWYDDVFEGATRTYVYQPASQGAGTHNQASHADIMARLKAVNCNAAAISAPDEALKRIGNDLKADDVVLFLTSGDLGGLIKTVPEFAEKKFPI
ncbi:MAG: Mur ligase family protein [Alphaproteobacteria bacterium]|nr:Mur ligase family protein [Alphaproteobacteria bacterium]